MEQDLSPFNAKLNLLSGEKIYFDFEEDFVEQNMRCIPMIVRFKMDAASIKLKLADWCKFTLHERIQLALMPLATTEDIQFYSVYLTGLLHSHTGSKTSTLPADLKPLWSDCTRIPAVLLEKVAGLELDLPLENWAELHELKRFALVKLCTSDHENKNLPKALIEFGLMQK